jgi:hypothetical protein
VAGNSKNNIQRSYGVNGNLLNIRTSISGTFELLAKDIQELITSPPLVFNDGLGIGCLTLGTNNGKILFYDEAAGNPALINTI